MVAQAPCCVAEDCWGSVALEDTFVNRADNPGAVDCARRILQKALSFFENAEGVGSGDDTLIDEKVEKPDRDCASSERTCRNVTISGVIGHGDGSFNGADPTSRRARMSVVRKR